MHSRRALLYMPGDDRRKIEKATTLGVDCICMDLEDGVAITRKTEARAVIAQAMQELDFGASERCIRINSFGSGFEKFDLAAAVATNPDAVVVPKIESAAQVRSISEHIEMYELSSNMEIGTIRMLVGVETAKGILNLKEIAEASGGQAFFPKSIDQVEEICRRIARDLRNQYTLGFISKNDKQDGSFRKITVKLVNPPKQAGKVEPRTRDGYFAPGGPDVPAGSSR